MFDPVKITTFVSLAAAAIWAACYVKDAKRGAQLVTLVVTLGALSLTAWLEWSKHADPCAGGADLKINEFCAEGKECDGGNDFVEVINPSDEPADLGCYALMDRRSTRSDARMAGNPFILPAGETLEPGEVRAWDEVDTRFQLSWKRGDRLRLSRLSLRPGEQLNFVLLDEVVVNKNNSYAFRRPGDLGWIELGHDDLAKGATVGTLGSPNVDQGGVSGDG